MTTAWANVMHGHVTTALRTHVSGTMLAFVALVIGAWATAVAVRGKHLAWRPTENMIAWAAVALTGLIIGEWTIRLLAG